MYLSASNDKIQVVLSGAVTTNQIRCVASYQDITSAGMTLPQASNQVLTNDTTAVDLVGVAAASTTRQVTHMNIYNADTVAATVTVQKDVSATDYILTKALLQAGDTLQWSRESGWNILTQSSQSSVLLTEFTASGTWTKRAGLKSVLVWCGGAGGGAGSGRQGIAGENRYGGGGGGGGAFVWRFLSASDLAATVTVTCGAGGTSGASQASTSSNGSAGGAGGDTSFGALVVAKGGSAGGGGSTAAGTAGAGGVTATGTPVNGPFAIPGAAGVAGATTANAAGGAGLSGTTSGPGGGGGGGISNTNVSGVAAMTGGGINQNGVVQAGPVSGASPNGVNNKCLFFMFNTTLSTTNGPGTGGAGNNPATTTGGNGGYCAGAGGGSGTLNGTASGAGGVGGGGLCIVMEFY